MYRRNNIVTGSKIVINRGGLSKALTFSGFFYNDFEIAEILEGMICVANNSTIGIAGTFTVSATNFKQVYLWARTHLHLIIYGCTNHSCIQNHYCNQYCLAGSIRMLPSVTVTELLHWVVAAQILFLLRVPHFLYPLWAASLPEQGLM